MKNVVYCILLLLLTACSSSNPEVRVRPTLSAVELTVRVGETAVITVNDAENVSAKVRDEAIAIIDVSSNKISISGVKKGDTLISVTADGYSLSCNVHVTAEEEPPSPEPEEDVKQKVPLRAFYSLSDESIDLYSPYISEDVTWTINGKEAAKSCYKPSELGIGRHEIKYFNSILKGMLIIEILP